MLYMIFQSGWEPVLIQRISIGLKVIQEKFLLVPEDNCMMNHAGIVALSSFYLTIKIIIPQHTREYFKSIHVPYQVCSFLIKPVPYVELVLKATSALSCIKIFLRGGHFRGKNLYKWFISWTRLQCNKKDIVLVQVNQLNVLI